MRISGRQLLMLVRDGVDYSEYEQLRQGFEEEGAVIRLATPQSYLSIETVDGHRCGRSVLADVSLEGIEVSEYDGIIIPDGVLSTGLLREDARVFALITAFHEIGKPIFASGSAVDLLYECHILSRQVMVRDGQSLDVFLDRAVGLLSSDLPGYDQTGEARKESAVGPAFYKYRPTM